MPLPSGEDAAAIRYGSEGTGNTSQLIVDDKQGNSYTITLNKSLINEKIEASADLGDFGEATIRFLLTQEETETPLVADITMERVGYFERYFLFLFDSRIREAFYLALENLKVVSEELRLSRITEPEMIVLDRQVLMLVRDSVPRADHYRHYQALLERAASYLDRRNIGIAGDPLAVIFSHNRDSMLH